MNELAKTIAIKFKSGESMQDIAKSLGITMTAKSSTKKRIFGNPSASRQS